MFFIAYSINYQNNMFPVPNIKPNLEKPVFLNSSISQIDNYQVGFLSVM